MKAVIGKNVRIFKPNKYVVRLLKSKFTIPNPTYLENQRMHRRNYGVPKYLKLFKRDTVSIHIPLGGIDYLMDICNKRGYRLDLVETGKQWPVNIKFKGQLKPFQEEAMAEVIQFYNGTLVAPTGSGKTVMGIFALCYHRQRTLIIVHTKDLAQQWIARLTEFTDLTPVEIGLLGDNKKQMGRRVTVGLIQTIANMSPKEIRSEFGFVIVDECHRTPSRTFTDALGSISCALTLGLTATPFRRDGLTQMIEWYCGSIRFSIEKERLIDEGHVMQPKFIIKSTDYMTDFTAYQYTKMLSELTQDKKRNRLIVKEMVKVIKQTPDFCGVVLTDRKEHCGTLFKMFKKKGIDVCLLTGDIKGLDRTKAIDHMNEGGQLMVATGQLIGEGFDCKNLNALVLASPIKFSGRVIQYAGRIMRPAKGKEQPIVYDFADWSVPVLAKSAQSRIRTYGKKNCIVE